MMDKLDIQSSYIRHGKLNWNCLIPSCFSAIMNRTFLFKVLLNSGDILSAEGDIVTARVLLVEVF
jgi:hypothetical protein